jgi:hypothetical protein
MKVNSRVPHKEARFSVLLPDFYCRGNHHAEVITNVRVIGGTLCVDLIIYGEDFEVVDQISKAYNADALHVSALSRKGKG